MVKYRWKRRLSARKGCVKASNNYIIKARAVQEKVKRKQVQFDTDSCNILIENCCSHVLTNDINGYIEPPVKSEVKVQCYNDSTNSTKVGIVKWEFKDDNGKVHNYK
jgi:hypothetical protein